MLNNDPYRFLQLARLHSAGSDDFRSTILTSERNLGRSIAEDMDMSGRVIVQINDEIQPGVSKHGDHPSI